MVELFHSTSEKCSRIVTEGYSTSFFSAIGMLHTSLRKPVYNIYGFVILSDKVIEVDWQDSKYSFLITDLNNLNCKLNGYEGEPAPPFYNAGTKDGFNNVLSFQYEEKTYKYRLYISNKKQLYEITKIVKTWKQ